MVREDWGFFGKADGVWDGMQLNWIELNRIELN
jgi:hypothetical protein